MRWLQQIYDYGTKNKYVPGVCNIGPAEIKKRKQAGWIGFGDTIVLLGILIYFNATPIWRLTLFIPAMMLSTGFLQAYIHYCAYLGLASLFNFNDVGKTDTIQLEELRTRDRQKAWLIIIYSLLIGLTITFFPYIL